METLSSFMPVLIVIVVIIISRDIRSRNRRVANKKLMDEKELILTKWNQYLNTHPFNKDMVVMGRNECFFVLAFDNEAKKMIYVSKYVSMVKEVYYNEIVSFSILKNDIGSVSKRSMSIRSGILGLLGGDSCFIASAVYDPVYTANTVDSIGVHIITRNLNNNAFDIKCWNTPCDSNSPIYKQQCNMAQQIHDYLLSAVKTTICSIEES